MTKKKLFFFVAGVIFTLSVASCSQNGSNAVETQYVATQGAAQGTSWHIRYRSFDGEDLTPKFDSILKAFDNSISTYNKQSLLTKINNNEKCPVDSIISVVFRQSQRIYELSGGLFDPTCRPLVNAWGFGKHTDLKVPSQAEIDSILEFVGMDKVRIDSGRIVKADPRVTLNFNANAQGYSVDILCDYLEANGYTDYVVEVGGETRAAGRNQYDQPWRVGIDSPVEGSTVQNREINTIVPLSGKSLCTSGDYRNFFKTDDGRKFSHELNPKTGYPKDDSLLSVSVLADLAIDGDALATAVMVMGFERGFRLIDSLPDTEGYFIYATSKGGLDVRKTDGFVTNAKDSQK